MDGSSGRRRGGTSFPAREQVRMSADREIANAISEGLNCIAEVVAALSAAERRSDDAPGSARPEWPEALEAMERAFDAVVAGEATSSLVARGEDIGRLRRMRALVLEWLKHGRANGELKELAEVTVWTTVTAIANARTFSSPSR